MTDRAAERWEGRSAAELAREWGVPAVHLYSTLGSTNDVARALAERGAPAGTVVLAEEQTAGRGRSGRAWASPPGLGIWLSAVLRPTALPAPGLLPLRVGLAAAGALVPFARPGVVQVKWPNDLLVSGRKLGGILCEGAWDAGTPSFVVVGIGINAWHASDDFPEEIRPRATSLRIAGGWTPPRAEVTGALVRAVAALPPRLPATLDARELAELEARDALRGLPVQVRGAAGPALAGTALGINPEGALLVRTPEGALRTVTSGTVLPAGGGAVFGSTAP